MLARNVFAILAVLGLVASAYSMGLYWFQDYLIFHPKPLRADAPPAEVPGVLQGLVMTASEGGVVRGWVRAAKPTGSKRRGPAVLYFGGNAEETSWILRTAPRELPGSLVVTNYRGYGASEGTPSEAALFADSIRLWDAVAAHPNIDPKQIFVVGRSLGTGVAVYLAGERPVAAVALISPYDSVRQIAEDRYPWLPIRKMLKHHFDSLARAPAAVAPALMLAAGRDRTVESFRAERLFRAWGAEKQWHLYPNANHQSIVDQADFWSRIATFFAFVAEEKVGG